MDNSIINDRIWLAMKERNERRGKVESNGAVSPYRSPATATFTQPRIIVPRPILCLVCGQPTNDFIEILNRDQATTLDTILGTLTASKWYLTSRVCNSHRVEFENKTEELYGRRISIREMDRMMTNGEIKPELSTYMACLLGINQFSPDVHSEQGTICSSNIRELETETLMQYGRRPTIHDITEMMKNKTAGNQVRMEQGTGQKEEQIATVNSGEASPTPLFEEQKVKEEEKEGDADEVPKRSIEAVVSDAPISEEIKKEEMEASGRLKVEEDQSIDTKAATSSLEDEMIDA